MTSCKLKWEQYLYTDKVGATVRKGYLCEYKSSIPTVPNFFFQESRSYFKIKNKIKNLCFDKSSLVYDYITLITQTIMRSIRECALVFVQV